MEDQKALLDKIEESLTLARENNKLIKAMRRDALIGGIIKTLIWVVLILGSFYLSAKLLEPYLSMLQSTQEGTDYGALFEEYKSLLGQ